MNEVLVLKRTGNDADDSMFSCYTGVCSGSPYTSDISVFWDGRRVDRHIKSYLRKTNKSVDEYESTEEVIKDFLSYCMDLEGVGKEYDWYENEEK